MSSVSALCVLCDKKSEILTFPKNLRPRVTKRGAVSSQRVMNTHTSPESVTAQPAPRLDHWRVAPAAMQGMLALQAVVDASGLEAGLRHLVTLRVSQLNGCAYCANMHAGEARAGGESEQRLHLVAVWREAPVFTARERAALHWTEALTRLASAHVTDADFAVVRSQFTEPEIVNLTLAIVTINSWNRFGASFLPPLDSLDKDTHS